MVLNYFIKIYQKLILRFKVTMSNQKKVSCPTCAKKNTWNPGNDFRPFCSERCKLIDLGEWASDTRKIPEEPIDIY